MSQLCFSMYVSAEENLYCSAEKVSYVSSSIVVNIRNRTKLRQSSITAVSNHAW